MGYELNKNYWNQGIMTEAIEMILKFIFTETDVNRIEAFVKEGEMREYELCRGELIDITLWGILRRNI